MYKFLGIIFFWFFAACSQGPKSQVSKSRLPPPGFERLPQILILGRPESLPAEKKYENTQRALQIPSRSWLESSTGFRVEGLEENTTEWDSQKALERLRDWNSRPFNLWVVFDPKLISLLLKEAHLPLEEGRRILLSRFHFEAAKTQRGESLDSLLKPFIGKRMEAFDFDAKRFQEVLDALIENKNIGSVAGPKLGLKFDEIYLGPLGFAESIKPSQKVVVGVSWENWLKKIVASKSDVLSPEESLLGFYNSTMKMEINPNFAQKDLDWEKRFSTWQTQISLYFLRSLF